MATAKMMWSRFWELYSRDVIFFGAATIALMCFIVSTVAGFIAGYVFTVVVVVMVANQNLPPFSWIDNDLLALALVILAPLTAVGIIIGTAVWIVFAPFFLMWDIHRRHKKDGEPWERDTQKWVIGICIYYAVWAAIIKIIIAST